MKVFRKQTFLEVLTWVAFGAMLVAMFGFDGERSKLTATVLAAMVFGAGMYHLARRRQRCSAQQDEA